MSIATIAAAAAAALRSESPRAKSRTLDASEIEYAIRQHLRVARRLRRTDADRTVRTTLTGGHVPNSYRYRADADHVAIEGETARDLKIHTCRTYAQRRPNGDGSTLIVRSKTPEQEQGRIEVAL